MVIHHFSTDNIVWHIEQINSLSVAAKKFSDSSKTDRIGQIESIPRTLANGVEQRKRVLI